MAATVRIDATNADRPTSKQDLLSSGILALTTTLISFGIADMIFLARAQDFVQWRQVRTDFAFDLPSEHYMTVIICWLVATTTIRERQWVLPFGIGIVLFVFCIPGWAWSGPGSLLRAVMPLFEFRFDMLVLAAALNGALAVAWIITIKRLSATTN